MKKVYISYDKKDQKKADEIFEYFERNGISCFMAPDSIPEDETYASSVPKAIKECDIFLLLLSDDVQKSSWVSKEIELAIEERKKLIPFQVEECMINDTYKFYFGSTNIVDGTKDYVEKLDEIVLTVKKEKKVESKENTAKEEKESKKEEKNVEAKKESKKQENNSEEKEKSRKKEENEKKENVKPENGIGKYVYPNGNFYEGEWVDGKRCGFGILSIKNVAVFFAIFNDDQAERGILHLNDGTFTTGIWQKNDEIIIETSPRESLDWVKQNRSDFFKIKKYKNGDEYQGYVGLPRFLPTVREDVGLCKYANGDKYIGYWWADYKSGYGTYYYNNHELYTGCWKQDKKEGLGIKVSKEGDIFFGTFKKDLSVVGIRRTADGKLELMSDVQQSNTTSIDSLINGEWKDSNGKVCDIDPSLFQPFLELPNTNTNVGMRRKESGENQCPLCHGYGKISKIDKFIATLQNSFVTCPRCNGKGHK